MVIVVSARVDDEGGDSNENGEEDEGEGDGEGNDDVAVARGGGRWVGEEKGGDVSGESDERRGRRRRRRWRGG